ncbi:hypothetical protein KTJ16_06270 [Acinetobacter bereziniae]|uniref:immunity protein Imm33 domain-containing protein n=1 Tax=Acinetobacter TaxID=469 RepID=UPI000EF65DFC|nr:MULTISPECIES: hypothetical protein [Acinetobacter]MBJ8420675.1 hypothetical protein [Acinetobacter bereziniae]MBJ8443647.1 hypothetical protein [Acinetobacter bereziniae]MCU4475748.1 hypothetical protein [Acinetobacter bereziniae]MCU4540778.1 hypothetical protein [Acinetobacter bereziniae]MCU4624933.1 hypothetical protein [Acinetobacter bereziniae]
MRLEGLQKQICEKYNSKYIQLDDMEMVAFAMQSLGQQPIYAVRMVLEKEENVSWFIHCGEYSSASDFYQAIHVSHLHQYLPEILPYLALEPGFQVIIDKQGYEDVWLNPIAK